MWARRLGHAHPDGPLVACQLSIGHSNPKGLLICHKFLLLLHEQVGFATAYEYLNASQNPALFENINTTLRNSIIANTRMAGVNLWAAGASSAACTQAGCML
jgi:hypothetical protein